MDILPEIDSLEPTSMENLIGKTANITTIDNEAHQGEIYVVDPISKTVVLLQIKDGAKTLKILMHHALKTFTVTAEPSRSCHRALLEPLFEQDIEERRVRLRNWLKKNLIEVVEEGPVLKIQDDFSIGPPYTVSQCVSSNEIILERMIQLIEKMPH